jgi:predicted AAA+ superfamily ATPase
MGPRRVGKTVLLHHAIRALLASGVPSRQIGYVSVDHPLYNDCDLLTLHRLLAEAAGSDPAQARWVVFDEVQYRRGWEVQLKALVDEFPQVRFIASGSAAAALRRKSHESGAGRFTDLLLPPLTFHEFLELSGRGRDFSVAGLPGLLRDIDALNTEFVEYLNFGGYPEMVMSSAVRNDADRFIRSDIIDKVLLRDLPSLYGIEDIQELNRLFTTLAFNTGQEVSLERLSKASGVSKNTLKRYLEYLEAAFLIRVVHRIDRNARRFSRAVAFKVHLTNPSMRAALFAPVDADDEAVGPLVETAIASQWLPGGSAIHYARWADGEVDIVRLDGSQRPDVALEVKWSDRVADHRAEAGAFLAFLTTNTPATAVFTTRTHWAVHPRTLAVPFVMLPSAVVCGMIGYSLLVGSGPFAEVEALAADATLSDRLVPP